MAGPFGHLAEDPPFQSLGGALYKAESEVGYEFYKKAGTQFVYHRESGPARIWEDMVINHEEYWVDGKCHRTDGPAVVHSVGGIETPAFDHVGNINFYLGNSGLIYMEWWLQDEKIELRTWLHRIGLPDCDLAMLLLKHC